MAHYREARVCKCGRIHFIDDTVDKAIREDKEVLLVCGHCGTMTRIGADVEENRFWKEDGSPKKSYLMYSIEVRDSTKINNNDVRIDETSKEIFAILYSKGTPVPMKTGYYADSYRGGQFVDTCFPETGMQVLLNNGTIEDIREFYNGWLERRQQVNWGLFMKSLSPEEQKLVNGLAVFAKYRKKGIKE